MSELNPGDKNLRLIRSIYLFIYTLFALMLVSFTLASAATAMESVHKNHFVLFLETVEATFNIGNPPMPGDQVLFSRNVFLADLSDPSNPQPQGNVIGSNSVICTVAGPAGLLCQGSVSLDGRGSLTLTAPFTFQNPTEVAVTGGTGWYSNARGSITALELNEEGDQVYYVDLSGSKN